MIATILLRSLHHVPVIVLAIITNRICHNRKVLADFVKVTVCDLLVPAAYGFRTFLGGVGNSLCGQSCLLHMWKWLSELRFIFLNRISLLLRVILNCAIFDPFMRLLGNKLDGISRLVEGALMRATHALIVTSLVRR